MSEAAAFLGGTEAAPPPSPEEAAAALIYDAPSSGHAPPATDQRAIEVEKLAQASDAMPLGSEVGVAIERAAAEFGQAEGEAKAVAQEWLGTFRAHGITDRYAVDLVTIGAHAMRSGPPDDATFAQWTAGIDEALVAEFGSQFAANEAAELAREYVARDPALFDFLDRTGLCNHPRVVTALARGAVNARRAGKF